jgi:hypothetical protein
MAEEEFEVFAGICGDDTLVDMQSESIGDDVVNDGDEDGNLLDKGADEDVSRLLQTPRSRKQKKQDWLVFSP